MSMDNVPTLGSALLRGDEQSRSQVNSILLGLIQSSTSLDKACSSRDETRRRSGKRHHKTTGDKKDRKRRRKEEREEEEEVEKKRPNKQRVVRRVDRNKSAGRQEHKKTQESRKMKVEMQITSEAEVQVQERSIVEIRRTASEEVFVPMLPTADVYDFFDYHYYPQSAYSTPLPSPHTRSTPSSPYASPFLSCETRSAIHVPSASFSYAPSTVAISSFGLPCPIDAIWALPSRPTTPSLDYCTQLLLQ